MSLVRLDYFYDSQMRRYLEQIVRAFSGFQYKTGASANGPGQLKIVPCRMASTNKMVANIIRNNSENTLLSVPMITVWQTAFAGSRDRLQNPQHVDTRQVIERDIDPVTGKYTNARGNSYTVERLMPRPFEMTVQVDIWTSNLDQKHQLAEQILTIMYPGFDIQNSENGLDWTALTSMYIEDITWSSRSLPIGTSEEIDIMTITLRLPFWLSPPAKVEQQKIIEQIVTNIQEAQVEGMHTADPTIENLMAQNITTPGNHFIRVNNGTVTLLGPESALHDEEAQIYPWEPLLRLYGFLQPAISQLRLKLVPDIEDQFHEVVGTLQADDNNPNRLYWQIDPDTLPANTLNPVDAIIDPVRNFPGDGSLPAAAEGQRYMIVNDLGGPTQAWGSIRAEVNDIIEFKNGSWTLVFDSSTVHDSEYMLNLHTGRQLRWTGKEWVLSIDGDYGPGYWRLKL